jgi:hypothetical protein
MRSSRIMPQNLLRSLQFCLASQMFLLMVATTKAQQPTNASCSAAATQTIDGKYKKVLNGHLRSKRRMRRRWRPL